MRFKEDDPGDSPPGVDGDLEKTFFNAEKGAHDQQMRKIELGLIGCWLGGERNAPISIALVCILAGIVFAIGCLLATFLASSSADLWSRSFERSLAFICVVIAYVFGRGGRSGD